MASEEHLKILRKGVAPWNQWRKKNESTSTLDLSGADLRSAQLANVNLSGVDLSGANLSHATLAGADLSSANLKHATISSADIRNASLKGTDLSGANITNANLTSAFLRDCVLTDADLNHSLLDHLDLTGTNLSRANLNGSYLAHTKLEKTDLSYANLTGAGFDSATFDEANLSGTKLQKADLKNADLTGAKSLLQEQLAGTDVTNAKLPQDVSDFSQALGVIEKAVSYARKIYFAMLLGCAYSLLTAFTTTDVDLVTNSATSQLPIIGATVSIAGYYAFAPGLLLGFYIYFHISMQRIWEKIARLPAVLPDGRPIDNATDPWLLMGFVRTNVYLLRLNADKRLGWRLSRNLRISIEQLKDVLAYLVEWSIPDTHHFVRVQNLLSGVLAWITVPITIGWMVWRYLAAHDMSTTSSQVILLALALTFCVHSFWLTRATLRSAGAKLRPREAIRRLRTAAFFGAAFLAVVFFLSYIAYRAAFWPSENPAEDLWVTADLDEKHISTKPVNYIDLKLLYTGSQRIHDFQLSDKEPERNDEEGTQSKEPHADADGETDTLERLLEAVIGADLRGRDLRGARAKNAFFANADLRRAILSGARLRGADLSGADLGDADLRGAELMGAKLVGADLSMADLREVDFGADLSHRAIRQRLSYDSGMNALVLSEPSVADLRGAILLATDLRGVNLHPLRNLTQSQIDMARGDESTKLPQGLKRPVHWDKSPPPP